VGLRPRLLVFHLNGWRVSVEFFGIRDRLNLARRFEPRPGPGGPVTHKVGLTTAGEELKAKPEFEELRRRWEG
jgi:hypothetical protein